MRESTATGPLHARAVGPFKTEPGRGAAGGAIAELAFMYAGACQRPQTATLSGSQIKALGSAGILAVKPPILIEISQIGMSQRNELHV